MPHREYLNLRNEYICAKAQTRLFRCGKILNVNLDANGREAMKTVGCAGVAVLAFAAHAVELAMTRDGEVATCRLYGAVVRYAPLSRLRHSRMVRPVVRLKRRLR